MANNTQNTSCNRLSSDETPQTLSLQWNIQGLRRKSTELQLLLAKYDPVSIALQETMFPETPTPSNFIKNYSLYIKQNPDNPSHSGMGLAIKSDIPHRRINLSPSTPAIAIEIDFPLKITLVSIYISPKPQPISTLKTRLSNMIKKFSSPFLLLGDFNGHSPLWGGSSVNARGRMLEQFIDENGLILLNNGDHTRIDPSTGCSSALDLSISTHNLLSQLSWKVHDDCCSSDHLPITISLDRAAPASTCRPRWKYELADWPSFTNEVFDAFTDNPPTTPIDFITNIYEIATHHIPRTSGSPGKKSVPWWTPEVRTAVKLRRKKLRALQRMAEGDRPNSTTHSEFKAARNAARNQIRQAKQDSWDKFISSINPDSTSKDLWDKVSRLSGSKSRPAIKLSINNSLTDNPSLITEHLADHFQQASSSSNYTPQFITHKQNSEASPLLFDSPNPIQNYNMNFEIEELEWALHRVQGSSAGPDDVGYPLLKRLPLVGKRVLLSLYNEIWDQGEIPGDWKEALLVPIPKPCKDRKDANSYRPISLLNCIGKVLEKMVNRRLMTLLESRGLLDRRQFAFRPGKSTDDYLTELEDLLDSYLERGMHGDVVSLDLSKAYDRAWRFPILKSLENWGIQGRMSRYVQSFLGDRRFRVIIGNCRSGVRVQENGIPQGSVIAPTLFLICMESLFNKIPPNVHILVYADDITLFSFHNFKSLARKRLQSAVNLVGLWADEIGFTIAPEKSQLLHISSNRKGVSKLPDISLNHSTIAAGNALKILGVYLDRTFSFRHHVSEVRSATEKRLRVVKSIASRVPCAHRTSILQIVNCWVLPKMFYGAGLVSRAPDLEKILQPLYNRVLRTANGVFCTSPTSALMAECGQLPFRHYLTSCVVSKAVRWLSQEGREDVPLVLRANQLLNSITNQNLLPIAPLPRSKSRPWNQPPPKIDLSLLKVTSAKDPPLVSQQHFNSLATKKYSFHHHIFTDGSVVQDKVGYGIFSKDPDINIKSSLPPSCSIFSAEAYALMKACSLPPHPFKPSVIFSDSASCLENLKNSSSNHPWLLSSELSSISHNISFCWVPGHKGISGNEKADRLADAGRDCETEPVAVPSMDAVRWTKNSIRESWDSEWFRNRDSVLRRVKPITSSWPDNPNPKHRRILSRLRIGHTRLTHSYRLDKTDPPSCYTCNVPLTIPHILSDCRKYDTARTANNLCTALELVLSPPYETPLIQFLKDTGLYDEI